ncbi:hypothetical protein [Rhizobium sp.]|jgi:hypothetical protein|uniref:hypothetical protein n=1 Tax=Rhizobium sp. TaxID=391 RepID=UPI000E8AC636|nr:hypothetical protein [Rhizobium sp.]
MDPGHDPIIYKALGGLLGTIAGLAYLKTRGWRDLITRSFISMTAAITFYFVPIEYFNWPMNNERIFAGATLIGFAAWPLAGFLFRWISEKSKVEKAPSE